MPKYEQFGQLRMSWGQGDRQEKYELNYLKSYSLTLTLCFNFRFIHNVLIDGQISTMVFKNKKTLLIITEINECHEFWPNYEVFRLYYFSKVPQNWLGDEMYSKILFFQGLTNNSLICENPWVRFNFFGNFSSKILSHNWKF